MNDLSHAFSYAGSDQLMVRNTLMVGAVPGKVHPLSDIDQHLRATAARHLVAWKIPLNKELHATHDRPYGVEANNVIAVNILSEYGGKDFHTNNEKADLVILCNIPREIPKDMQLSDNYKEPLSAQFRASHTGSAHHDDLASWQKSIERCGANVVMVSGADSFSLDELNDGTFFTVKIENGLGFLVKKDYFEQAETYLHIENSPLIGLIMPLQEGKQDFRYSWSSGQFVPSITLARL